MVFQSYLSWILLLLWIFHPRSPVRANGTFNRRDVLQTRTVTNKSLIYTQQKSTRFVLLQPWWVLSVLLVFEELAITMIVLFRPDYAKKVNKQSLQDWNKELQYIIADVIIQWIQTFTFYLKPSCLAEWDLWYVWNICYIRREKHL